MALQKINWTQIDTFNVPTGEIIELGSASTELHDIWVEDIHISGVSFFDYLTQVGYTGGTPTDITLAENSGLEFLTGRTLSTTYNSTLTSSLETVEDVGGIPAGTTVAEMTGKTFVEFVDELLFPVANPTYTIPTITFSGIASGTREIGSTISETLNLYGEKNDSGAFTQLRILRDGALLTGFTSLTQSSISDIAAQYGFADPNNPNYRYTIPSTYAESYVVPSSTYPESVVYRGDGNYNAGVAKKDNKGNTDTRTPAVRSTAAPQAASTNFNSSSRTITGIYPYFYGTSLTGLTAASVAEKISLGEGTKVLVAANGTLSIPYNVVLPGQFIWFAYLNHATYPTKTIWYVNALDTGDIDGSFITTPAINPVDSPDGYWTGINYKIHWSVYLTVQDTIEFRNS